MTNQEAPDWETHGRVASEEEAADIQTLFRDDPKDPEDPNWETHGGVQDEAEASDIHKDFWDGKPIPVGVNGPGVIGRHLIRSIVESKDLRIDAVGDYTYRLPQLARLLRSDSIYGPWQGHTVEIKDEHLFIDRQKVQYFAVKDPKDFPWETTPVEVVFETARVFNDPLDAVRHLRNPRPHTVILASSPKKNDCPVIIFGVNQDMIPDGSGGVISAATCSSNALCPIVAVLERELELRELTALTVHAATGENVVYDRLDDDPGKRGILDNILPEETGAAKTLFRVFPHLEGQLHDQLSIKAVRVPVSTGSVFSICARVSKSTTVSDMRSLFRSAAKEGLEGTLLPGIISVRDRLTAADVRGLPYAGIVDESSVKVFGGGRSVELSVFYDNIAGFNAQMMRLAQYVGQNQRK